MGLGLRELVLGVVGAVVGTILGCSSFVDSHFQTSYQTGLLKAEQLEREGFPAEALAIDERTLPRMPARSRQERPVVAVALAEIYNREDKVPQARAVLVKAAAASADVKKSAIAWLGLGRLEEQEGSVVSAELAYRSAVSADDSATTNLRLAQFL